jgi:hypothetical protein
MEVITGDEPPAKLHCYQEMLLIQLLHHSRISAYLQEGSHRRFCALNFPLLPLLRLPETIEDKAPFRSTKRKQAQHLSVQVDAVGARRDANGRTPLRFSGRSCDVVPIVIERYAAIRPSH